MGSIYEQLPTEYRASANPEDLLQLWRGDKIGRLATGMLCRLGNSDAAHRQVELAASSGVDALNSLIDRHTDGDMTSPLISVTTAISRAQGYSDGPGETIYELVIPASRLLRDPYNIGSPRRGNQTELFVVGLVEPGDIQALKTNNHDKSASDLIYQKEVHGRVITFLADPFLNPDYRHDPNKQPNPAGIWERV